MTGSSRVPTDREITSYPFASCVVAVVVTYQPDLNQLKRQLDALLAQVHAVVIVDNASHCDRLAWMEANAMMGYVLIRLDSNYGIARAQNIGIDWARNQLATHVLLMDQDSKPASDMVPTLLQALLQHPQAGAVGPWYEDSRRGTVSSPFVRIQGLRRRRLHCSTAQEVLLVDHLIASGCLIPMPVLDQVGAMREDFFIDFVDVQWCLRARHAGYPVYGVCAARLEHRLGDNPVRFFGREYPSHAPERHYFHVRNALLTYREPWVPLNWKLDSAWRLLLKMGFHVLVTAPRWRHLGQILKGLADGLRGRAGPRGPKQGPVC